MANSRSPSPLAQYLPPLNPLCWLVCPLLRETAGPSRWAHKYSFIHATYETPSPGPGGTPRPQRPAVLAKCLSNCIFPGASVLLLGKAIGRTYTWRALLLVRLLCLEPYVMEDGMDSLLLRCRWVKSGLERSCMIWSQQSRTGAPWTPTRILYVDFSFLSEKCPGAGRRVEKRHIIFTIVLKWVSFLMTSFARHPLYTAFPGWRGRGCVCWGVLDVDFLTF